MVSAREGFAAFRVVYQCIYMLFVTNGVWKWIMKMEIDFVCLTSDSLTTFAFSYPLYIYMMYFVNFLSSVLSSLHAVFPSFAPCSNVLASHSTVKLGGVFLMGSRFQYEYNVRAFLLFYLRICFFILIRQNSFKN